MIFDSRRCLLGEGALWHPERAQFFWCDILSRRVLSRVDGALRDWAFDGCVSALGWVDADRLLVATDIDLTLLDLRDDSRQSLCTLEADTPANRSNDGRADPDGGFWISTLSVDKCVGAGALYRFHGGKLHRLHGGLTIPNAICFTPDGRTAIFTDTPRQIIFRWALDDAGWPLGAPERWIDLHGTDLYPDGAVIDAHGNLWCAMWGSGQVLCFDPTGRQIAHLRLPASQPTCPAFGGPDLSTLYVTSAAVGLDEPTLTRNPDHGCTFRTDTETHGQKEHRVIL